MNQTNRNVLIAILLIIGWIALAVLQFSALFYLDDVDTPIEEENAELEENITDVNVVDVSEDDLNGNSLKESLESTVSVHVMGPANEEIESQGSGFVYSDNHIITNEHVVSGGHNYYIEYSKGEWAEATLVGEDRDTDIAVLRVDQRPQYADPLPIQEELPKSGEEVYAIGSPGSLENTITEGVVSGVERSMTLGTDFSIPDLIQTDAALNPGNSGGPLVYKDEPAVVGVNRATDGENLGFAISGRVTIEIANSLIETGDHEHPRLGIVTVENNPTISETDGTEGITIEDIIEDTAADGVLEEGQIILSVNGVDINDNEDLSSYLIREVGPGDNITMEIKTEDDETENVVFEVGSRNT